MNKYFLSLAMLLALSLNNVAFASDDDHHEHEERVDHYEVAIPATKNEALKLLRESLKGLEEAVAKKDLHQVHEISYSSEAAIKALSDLAPAAGGLKKKLRTLAHINEEVHEASEEDEHDEVAEEFAKLKANWAEISANYK